ncbi:calcium/calmodulin-dependent protein kinase type IV-like [Orbicella faveolata]|uniref:calcium/calmodulin-dependent protein kinase type IV-like n=1 Tax=Orbicella faveolata TaxID=48498 RepID=UPI0009E2A298|nr:calcium/calmodulin-dependent protein kinase type IV-like [Orbicella faveolata]
MANTMFSHSRKGDIKDFYNIADGELGRGASSVVKIAKHKGTNKDYAIKMITKTNKCDVHFLFQFVHNHHPVIIHRDLKPENLLYASEEEDAQLKIADFGLSKMLYGEQGNTSTVCGTPGYCAPEVLLGKPYDTKIDMWAVGVIAYILLCGFEPFYDERGDQAMFQRILRCDYEFVSPWWDEVSENAKDLVSKLIVLDPKKRLTAKQALDHPFVQGKGAKRDKKDKKFFDKLHEFNARRKFKGGMIAVTASTAFTFKAKK